MAADVLAGCRPTCGNITVPYPFGLTDGCYSPGFKMTCNETYDPPKLFMSTGNIEISKLSFDNVLMQGWIARDCYDELNSPTHVWTNLINTPYTFSFTSNKFTAIGCDTLALVYRLGNVIDFTSGCISLCHDDTNVVNGSCSGIGCCQTSIPRGLQRFDTLLGVMANHSRTLSVSPCSFAFLIDQDQFEFSVLDFTGFRNRNRVPIVLDWAVGNQTCAEARPSPEFLCSGPNTNCTDSTNGPGYKCSCNKGYEGNPYLVEGCHDINECEDTKNGPCVGICTNTPGSYTCSCSPGSTGDGRRDGSGCTSLSSSSKTFPIVKVVLGCGLGFLAVLVSASLLYWGLKRRRLSQLRERFFKQNGGWLLLQRQVNSQEEAAAERAARIFTADELRKATNNYNQSHIIGKGANGVVYKGILPDNREVAIKKSRVMDPGQVEQFINEVVILSQVIHRNVVKMIGCCLETEVPLLVYEFISNDTLSSHLYGPGNFASLSWESRLRIACETAGALAYLHSATTRPIIHRDIKSLNILLDQNFTAKVSDFGASRVMPMDEDYISTLVQGTLGYLDPEYFHTGLLTEKSDVYSFGVVLVELITGQPPVSSDKPEEERSLANFFLINMERNQVFGILEPRVVNEGDTAQLKEVAELARRCLSLTGEERPTMKEVAGELEQAKRYQMQHPWVEDNGETLEGGRLLTRDGSWSSASFASATNPNDESDAMLAIS
ncbi:putative wall-associated receptor kinase-like 16 [Dioscorea cayenensis subsp. rotundata]|uniref:Wall-associated receptor kinase-like 16 n=1 Tax=Dioscorea cayennensis subsp. rotundata TaxID=55577 RepID=A0AB40BNW0_DIOCR|nr:putative wall-associated receptor kinase-like 16 [Dioscorea cayenensis subsp. rotundata]